MEELKGGRSASIYRIGKDVIRPRHSWSPTVHLLLKHLHSRGFTCCPEALGFEGDNEILSFVEGKTFNYPLTGAIAGEKALESAGRMLRRLHDASEDFLLLHSSEDLQWMLPPREPAEVICHGDFTPYNVALTGDLVSGIFDFDTAHPAPRIWDLAFSVYCWAPYKTNPDDALGDLAEQTRRAVLFCNAYGADGRQREGLVELMILRLLALLDFMRSEAEAGDTHFIRNMDEGHHLGYLNDIEYLKINRDRITEALVDGQYSIDI